MSQTFGYTSAIAPPVIAGSTTTSSGSSQSISIPNANNGIRARCVQLTATGNIYVKFTKGASTVDNTGLMLPANFPLLFNCMNFDTISLLQETAGAKLNVVPIEV